MYDSQLRMYGSGIRQIYPLDEFYHTFHKKNIIYYGYSILVQLIMFRHYHSAFLHPLLDVGLRQIVSPPRRYSRTFLHQRLSVRQAT